MKIRAMHCLPQTADKPLAKSWGFSFNGNTLFRDDYHAQRLPPRQSQTLEVVVNEDRIANGTVSIRISYLGLYWRAISWHLHIDSTKPYERAASIFQ